MTGIVHSPARRTRHRTCCPRAIRRGSSHIACSASKPRRSSPNRSTSCRRVTWRRSAASTGGPGDDSPRVASPLHGYQARSNGFQELGSSAKRNTDLAEMILRQIVQNRIVDGVLAECRLILFEAKAPQPTPEVHAGALTCPARMMVQAKQRVHRTAFE